MNNQTVGSSTLIEQNTFYIANTRGALLQKGVKNKPATFIARAGLFLQYASKFNSIADALSYGGKIKSGFYVIGTDINIAVMGYQGGDCTVPHSFYGTHVFAKHFKGISETLSTPFPKLF